MWSLEYDPDILANMVHVDSQTAVQTAGTRTLMFLTRSQVMLMLSGYSPQGASRQASFPVQTEEHFFSLHGRQFRPHQHGRPAASP